MRAGGGKHELGIRRSVFDSGQIGRHNILCEADILSCVAAVQKQARRIDACRVGARKRLRADGVELCEILIHLREADRVALDPGVQPKLFRSGHNNPPVRIWMHAHPSQTGTKKARIARIRATVSNQVMTNPPFTPRIWPVTNGASARYATACAISVAVPRRSMGVSSRKDSSTSDAIPEHISV